MTVLVLAASDDLNADLVVLALEKRGAEVFRWDTADFPQRTQFTAWLTRSGWQGSVTIRERVLDLDDVTSIYCRRLGAFDLQSGLTEAERRFAYEQAEENIGGVLLSLNCRWINSPPSLAVAESKPRQAAVARRFGLTVARPDNGALPGNGAAEHRYQQHSAPKMDVRVTAVGDQVFATSIHYLDHQPVELPGEVRAGVLAYLRAYDLIFGAFDFTVETDGTLTFLECDPNGEWAFIEQTTGQPISAAIATELTRAPNRP